MSNITKQCTKCQQPKTLDNFSVAGKTVSGELKYQSRCKPCVAEAQRQARSKEPERFREASKKCHTTHRDERLANMREYLENNYEKEKSRKVQWQKDNPEAFRVSWHKYRVKRKGASDGTVTTEFARALYAQVTCTYCGKETLRSERSLDHVIPVSSDGLHSVSNLVMCCKPCNSSKKDRPLKEWLESKK